MKYALITDTTVEKLYRDLFPYPTFSFPAGEKYKTRETKALLEDRLLKAGFARDTTLIGLGGGVVTDMAGFIAATFCRGVPLVLIPTTLLAMVDASIGGKNGVNTPLGKNMVGTFYPPKKVVIDSQFLKTLPEKEMWNGQVEILKAGLVANPQLFHAPNLERAIEVKRELVFSDPHEKGKRRILNFGHTIGHALELLSDFQLCHGEAVATGIVLESRLSHAMGILDSDSLESIEAVFPPVALTFQPEKIIEAMRLDKKSAEGLSRFILLEKIGQPRQFEGEYCAPVPESILYEVLHDAALHSSIR